jgi:hypothetical protein
MWQYRYTAAAAAAGQCFRKETEVIAPNVSSAELFCACGTASTFATLRVAVVRLYKLTHSLKAPGFNH